MVTAGRIMFAAIDRWVPEQVTYHILPFVLMVTFVLVAALPSGAVGRYRRLRAGRAGLLSFVVVPVRSRARDQLPSRHTQRSRH